AFVLSGQVLRRHQPALRALPADVHLMFVSRHIYLLGGGLVNVCLGLYLRLQASVWRRATQVAGSVMVFLSPVFSLLAFLHEREGGMPGHSWRTPAGLLPLFAGVLLHVLASVGAKSDSPVN